MTLIPLLAMVRKDLQLFFADRRSVITAFAVPIAIASFFGSIFSGQTSGERARIDVAIVDQDGSAISQSILKGAEGDPNLRVSTPDAAAAREAVRAGRLGVAVVIPKGFGDAAGRAFFSRREKPVVDVLYDPSRTAEVGLVRGVMTEHVMEAVSREMFTGSTGRAVVDDTLGALDDSGMAEDQKRLLRDLLLSVRGLQSRSPASDALAANAPGISLPYAVREEAMTSGDNVLYNSYAHAFAGMGIQFLLFAATNLGLEMLLERERGLWKRLRSSPVSRLTLLGGKTISATLVALMTLLVSFGFAMIVFHVRIQGSILGFAAVAIACSLMAATYGVLVAAVGRTPATARGVIILTNLMMVMLGGAWVPTFVFPSWLQRATVVVPVRWAVDGLDSMTWRGLGFSSAIAPTLVLLAFAAIFGIVAFARFRWEEV